MKRYIYALVALALLSVEGLSAQMKTSYFMEGSYFRTEMNPALAPTRGYVALPFVSGFDFGLSGNVLSVDNFVYQTDKGLVTALNGAVSSDEFLSRLPEIGLESLKADINLFGVGFYTGRMFWNFGTSMHVNGDIYLSKDIFRAVKSLGNGLYDLGNVGAELNAYMDAYVGTSIPIGKHVNVGVRAKFLVGLANASATFNQLQVNVTEDGVVGTANGEWRGNAFMLDAASYNAEEGMESLINIDTEDPVAAAKGLMKSINSFGAALDLGAEARFFNDHLKVSAAVTDLGFIKWNAKSHLRGAVSGDFHYNGYDFETQELDAGGSFNTDNLIYEGVNDGYTSYLNCAVNAGVEYNFLKNHFAVGLLSHTRFYRGTCTSELTASLNIRPVNWITLTASHTFLNKNRPGIFGAAINIHPRVLNIFVGMDYIDPNLVYVNDSILVPRYAKSLNVYFGLGFNMARPKFMRQEQLARKAEKKAARKAARK